MKRNWLPLCLAAVAVAVASAASAPVHVNSFEEVTVLRTASSSVTRGHATKMNLRSETGHPVHAGFATFKLPLFGENVHLDVRLNEDLIADRYVGLVDGKIVEHGAENCYYLGNVRKEDGSAGADLALHTCSPHGVTAYIYDDAGTIVVEPQAPYETQSTTDTPATANRGPFSLQSAAADVEHPIEGVLDVGRHIVYRTQDLKGQHARTCGTTDEAHIHEEVPDLQRTINGIDTELRISPTSRKLLQTGATNYVELFLVSDVRQTSQKGGDAGARQAALNIINNVNVLYTRLQSYKIIISVIAQEAWTAEPAGFGTVTQQTDITNYLDAFLSWSQTNRNSGATAFDVSHMLIGYDLSGGTAGVAYVSAMCDKRFGSGVSEDASSVPGRTQPGYAVWTTETVTHEIGHNLGCRHDSDRNTCNPSQFIMAAVGSIIPGQTSSPKQWSTCSETYISTLIQSKAGTPGDCMKNVPRTAGANVCGDGLIGPGEDCEPALNPNLCTAQCKFRTGVQCTSGDCCDLTLGTIKARGVICRAAMHQCDLPDWCDGRNSTCTSNDYKVDGTPCDEAGPGGQCNRGSCKGYDGQCREDFSNYADYGTWTKGPQSCYTANNCGDLFCQVNNDGRCYYLSYTDDNGATRRVQVAENTPCDNCTVGGACPRVNDVSQGRCQAGQCTKRAAQTVCAGGCGQGDCSQSGVCVCTPGYTGSACNAVVAGCRNCTAIGRQGCILGAYCGPCLRGLGSQKPFELDSPCTLVRPSQVSATGSQAIFGTTHNMAFDQMPFSHFVANFTPTLVQTRDIYVEAQYSAAFTLVYYDVLSGNTLPGEDPRSWVIEGSNDATTAASPSWTAIDARSDVLWDNRHETKYYLIPCKKAAFSRYRMRVTATRDPTISPSLQIAEINFYHYGGRPVTEPICDVAGATQHAPTVFSLVAAALLVAIMQLVA